MDVVEVRAARAVNGGGVGPAPMGRVDPEAIGRYLNRQYPDIRRDMFEFFKDDLFKPRYDLSFYEFRELTHQRLKRIAQAGFISCFDHIDNPTRFFGSMEPLTYVDYSITIKCGVHYSLAGGAIALLGTKKHHDKYLPLLDSGELPGCFAMTELGHGSNVMGIETTAHYDHGSRSFVINTPDDLASKVWIGGASQYGRICTVFAQLYVGGKWHGVHVFVVPLRSEDGKLLEGVRIEEMGHKMGLNGVDNGRIWFNNVKVDKNNLLDRYAQIDDNGEYKSPVASVTQRFGVMVGALSTGRVCIAQSAVDGCKVGLVVAARYASDRPQFGDRKIASYLTHQRRLAPAVAQTYALHLMMSVLKEMLGNRADPKKVHLLSSGLKAAATWTRVEILQNCRECCGGMGFLSDNMIPGLITDMNVDVTFEGDNTVLMQQVVKAILTKGVRRPETARLEKFDIEQILKVLKYREELLKFRISQDKDFDGNLDQAVDLGWAFTDHVVLANFAKEVAKAPKDIQAALHDLCTLYAMERVERNAVFYVCEGVLDGEGLAALRKHINHMCTKVSGPDGARLVKFTDGFGIPEHLITAPIAKGWRNFHTTVELGSRL